MHPAVGLGGGQEGLLEQRDGRVVHVDDVGERRAADLGEQLVGVDVNYSAVTLVDKALLPPAQAYGGMHAHLRSVAKGLL